MRLILSRHGNTFGLREKAVWLGAKDDPPLVSEGVRQAERLAEALTRAGTRPSAVFSGPLQRMSAFAEILSTHMNTAAKPIIDSRLDEIDYGNWNGLSNEEVIERYGSQDFCDWYERNIWPSSGWGSDKIRFEAAVNDFIRAVSEDYAPGQCVVAITSHGVLKCLGSQLQMRGGHGLTRGWHRVDTGNICELTCKGGQIWVVSWNNQPDLVLGRATAV